MTPKRGAKVYLRFDSPSRGRLLVPAIAKDVTDDSWTLEFAEPPPAVEPGAEKLCCYWRMGEFLEQPVRVEVLSSAGDDLPFEMIVTALGAPSSADTRTEPRVDAAGLGLEVTLGDETHCPVQDVSLSGLGVIARSAYRVGEPIEIAISFDGHEYVGIVEVMGVTPLPDRSTRYGLLGVFDTREGRLLKIGLTRMTLEIPTRPMRRN